MAAIARQPDAADDETARAAWRAAYERLAREIQRGVAEGASHKSRHGDPVGRVA